MHKRKHHSHPSHKHHAKKHKVGLEPALNPFQYLNTPSPGGSSVGPPRPGPAPPKPPGPPPPKPPVPPPAPPKKDDTPWYDDPHFQDFLSGLKYTGMGLGGAVGLYALHKGFQVAKQQYADYKLRRSMGQRLRNNGNDGTEMTSRNRNLNEPIRDVPQLHGNPKAEGIFSRVYNAFQKAKNYLKSKPYDAAKKDDNLRKPLLGAEEKSEGYRVADAVLTNAGLRQRRLYEANRSLREENKAISAQEFEKKYSALNREEQPKNVQDLFAGLDVKHNADVPPASTAAEKLENWRQDFLKNDTKFSDSNYPTISLDEFVSKPQHGIGKAQEKENIEKGGFLSNSLSKFTSKVGEYGKSLISSFLPSRSSSSLSLSTPLLDHNDVSSLSLLPVDADYASFMNSISGGARSFPTPEAPNLPPGGGGDTGGGGVPDNDGNGGGEERPGMFGVSRPIVASPQVLSAPSVSVGSFTSGTPGSVTPVVSGDAAAAASAGLPNESTPGPAPKEWWQDLLDNVKNSAEGMIPWLPFLLGGKGGKGGAGANNGGDDDAGGDAGDDIGGDIAGDVEEGIEMMPL